MTNDTRNVVDKYRGWPIEAIRQDLDRTKVSLEIAIENLQRDFNMGTIVRTANAFNVSRVHIVGRRQWNKRGAMVTDRYLHLEYHALVGDFQKAMADRVIIGVDNVAGASPLSKTKFSENCVLVFGSEGPGLSTEMQAAASEIVMIEQFGSTRSINVGVAAGIVMYAWMEQNVLGSPH